MKFTKNIYALGISAILSACSGAVEAAKDAAASAEGSTGFADIAGSWNRCGYDQDMNIDLQQVVTISAEGEIETVFAVWSSANGNCESDLLMVVRDSGIASLSEDPVSVLNEDELPEGMQSSDFVAINVVIDSSTVRVDNQSMLGMLAGIVEDEEPVLGQTYDLIADFSGPGFVPAGSTKYTALGYHDGLLFVGNTEDDSQGFDAESRATFMVALEAGEEFVDVNADSDSASDSDEESDSESESEPEYLGAEFFGTWATCSAMNDMVMNRVFVIAENGHYEQRFDVHAAEDTNCEQSPIASFGMAGVATLSYEEFTLDGNYDQSVFDNLEVINVEVTESGYVGLSQDGVDMLVAMLEMDPENPPAINETVPLTEAMPGPGFVPAGDTKYTIISIDGNGQVYFGTTMGEDQGFSPETRDPSLDGSLLVLQ